MRFLTKPVIGRFSRLDEILLIIVLSTTWVGCPSDGDDPTPGPSSNPIQTCVGLVDPSTVTIPTALMTQCCDPGTDSSYATLLTTLDPATFKTCCASSVLPACNLTADVIVGAASSSLSALGSNQAVNKLNSSSTHAGTGVVAATGTASAALTQGSGAATAGGTTTTATPAPKLAVAAPSKSAAAKSGNSGGGGGGGAAAASSGGGFDDAVNAPAPAAEASGVAPPETQTAEAETQAGSHPRAASGDSGLVAADFDAPADTKTSEMGFAREEGAPLKLEDPEDYFTRTGIEESLFKKAHYQYIAIDLKWTKQSNEKFLHPAPSASPAPTATKSIPPLSPASKNPALKK